jgi:hypothetical protein
MSIFEKIRDGKYENKKPTLLATRRSVLYRVAGAVYAEPSPVG